MLGEGNIMGDKNGTLEHACRLSINPYLLNKDGSWATRKGVCNVFIMQSGNNTGKVQQNEWMTADGAESDWPGARHRQPADTPTRPTTSTLPKSHRDVLGGTSFLRARLRLRCDREEREQSHVPTPAITSRR